MTSSLMMVAFAGTELSATAAAAIAAHPPAGVTLFRAHNVASAEQVRALGYPAEASMDVFVARTGHAFRESDGEKERAA